MGWESRDVTIYMRLDRHGGERQEEADKLHQELMEALRKLLADPKWRPIDPLL